MIVADTGAIIALIDRKDRYHPVLRPLFEERPLEWILPWAILPEVDYLMMIDMIYFAAYLFVVAGLALVVRGSWLAGADNLELAIRRDRRGIRPIQPQRRELRGGAGLLQRWEQPSESQGWSGRKSALRSDRAWLDVVQHLCA